jgi:hypothetical protein
MMRPVQWPAERMRQRSIPEFQPPRGLAVRKAVPDLTAARNVSDRDISDVIASRMTCDIYSNGGVPYH